VHRKSLDKFDPAADYPLDLNVAPSQQLESVNLDATTISSSSSWNEYEVVNFNWDPSPWPISTVAEDRGRNVPKPT
jgi:hypothetical protein